MTVAATESTDKCFCVELFFFFLFCLELKEKKKIGFRVQATSWHGER
jgi:hypothetical protein